MFTTNNRHFPVNIITIYFKYFIKKLDHGAKISNFEYFISLCHAINFIKIIKCMFGDNETRYLLFDLSLFVGGVPVYNSFIILISYIYSLNYLIKIHINVSVKSMKWVEIFDENTGKISSGYARFNKLIFVLIWNIVVEYCFTW
jgi:hypothetical protein